MPWSGFLFLTRLGLFGEVPQYLVRELDFLLQRVYMNSQSKTNRVDADKYICVYSSRSE